MAVFSLYSGDPFTLQSQKDSSGVVESLIVDTAVDLFQSAEDALVDVFHYAADARLYAQGRTFDFGYWWMKYVLFDAVENIEEEYGEAAGLIAGTMFLAVGWTPLFVVSLMAYTNPWTAAVAAPIDAYNIHQYWESR